MNNIQKREQIQTEASNILINNNFNNVILNISPRVGKSKIVIDAINNNTLIPINKILITTPRKILKSVWEKQFKLWSKVDLSSIPIICNASLKNISFNNTYDLLIIDEVHCLSEKQMEYINASNFKYKIGITGSLSNDTKKQLKDVLNMDVLYKYSLDEAINDKIISDYRINIVYCHLDNVIKKDFIRNNKVIKDTELGEYNSLTNKFNQLKFLSLQNPNYNFAKMSVARKRADLIYSSQTKLDKAKEIVDSIPNKTLIFTTRTDSADYLCNHSYHYKSSEEAILNNFYKTKIKKLSVCNLGDMGLTFPYLKNIVIHQLQSNDETAIQKILRACNFDGNQIANIYITVFKDTVDEDWLKKALKQFNQSKIIIK